MCHFIVKTFDLLWGGCPHPPSPDGRDVIGVNLGEVKKSQDLLEQWVSVGSSGCESEPWGVSSRPARGTTRFPRTPSEGIDCGHQRALRIATSWDVPIQQSQLDNLPAIARQSTYLAPV
jgi:hypothetical protein